MVLFLIKIPEINIFLSKDLQLLYKKNKLTDIKINNNSAGLTEVSYEFTEQ